MIIFNERIIFVTFKSGKRLSRASILKTPDASRFKFITSFLKVEGTFNVFIRKKIT